MLKTLPLLVLCLAFAGCSKLGLEMPADKNAKKEADHKAVGAGCRFSNRSIEQCYLRNPKANKAGVFEGWKEMDAYMRENKIQGDAPVDAPAPSETETDEVTNEKH